MMKKLKLLFAIILFSLSIGVNADTIKNSELDLNNPDVRKCLLEASNISGWELSSVYLDSENKLVMIFDKENDTKIYTSKEAFSN